MKTRLLLLALVTTILASCASESTKLYVPREGEYEDSRHTKGTWIPSNS
jgi:hypothetical protein